MAKTRDYMDYLDNQIGIAPANSQEEFQAAETIIEVMKDHGIEPTVQEFDTHPLGVLMPSVLALVLFLGVLLAGLGGGIRVIGLILALAAAILLELHHSGKDVFENLGPVQRSQNVIGVHRASGENVVKGSRPIVVVAHYDTPRENLLFGKAFARYQSALYKNVYICVAVAAVTALTQVFGFLPMIVRVLLWIVGLVACVPLIIIAVANILERFASCTTGSNDNKASVAAMLSILNQVSPAEDRVDAAAEGKPYARRASEDEKPETVLVPEKPVGVRHGKEVIESLGMLPATCEIVYEEPKLVSVPAASQEFGDEPVPAQQESSDAPIGTADASTEGSALQEDGASRGKEDGPQESTAFSGQTENSMSTSTQSGVDERSQEPDGEQKADGTEDAAAESEEYNRNTSYDAPQSIPEREVDSTQWRDPASTDNGASGESSRRGRGAGKGVKAWFGRVKSRFTHNEEPVQIARGKNKESQGYADYSKYEATYSGDDELDQWSAEETEELRPLTARDIRGGKAERKHRITTQDDSTAPAQSLSDIYGLGEDEIAQVEEPDASEFEPREQPEQQENYDAEPNSEYSSDDVRNDDASQSAAVPATETDDDQPQSSAEAAQDVDSEETADAAPTANADSSDSAATFEPENSDESDAADAPREGGNAETPDSDATTEGWDVDTSDESDVQEEPVIENQADSIPKPVTIDTVQPQRRPARKQNRNQPVSPSNTLEDSEEVEEVAATTLPDDEGVSESDDQLNWDQPSVEDEEYYDEYPEDEASAEDYTEPLDDESYDDGAYDAYEEESSENVEDDAPNVYEQTDATQGRFSRFVNRVKRTFSRKSRESESELDDATYDQADGYSSYDEQAQGNVHDADEDNVTSSADEARAPRDAVSFEEVRSEEYLPSDEDAFIGDVDEDYDFPTTEEREAAPATDVSGDAGSASNDSVQAESTHAHLQFEDETDDRGDILPKDTTGLDALLDDDYADSNDAPHRAPTPIDDPSWGKSSYEPPVSRSSIARRAALLDLPNPSVSPVDPLAQEDDKREVGEKAGAADSEQSKADDTTPHKGSSNNRKRNWKGGAALRSDLRSDDDDVDQSVEMEPVDESATQESLEEQGAAASEPVSEAADDDDMQDAILDMGNDLLLSHDVWFVAVGASSVGHAGIKSFLANFRKDIRGAFLVNLDSIGAGVPVVLTREGLNNGKRADRRSLRLFESTARDLHVDVQSIDYGWRDTDATQAMRSRVRSITVMGMDENGLPALSHTVNDVPMNVDPKQVSSIVRVVCEFIRRS